MTVSSNKTDTSSQRRLHVAAVHYSYIHSMLGSTGQNDKLISAIEREIAAINKDYPSSKARYYGGQQWIYIMPVR